jgi:Carboxypeptidase regulatory-like domain
MRLVPCWFVLALASSFHIVAGQIVFQAGTGPPQPLAQGNSQARHTVTGIVTNAITAEPIRRALVRVNGLGQHYAFTGPDGRFEIDGVPEGQVLITAQKPGFVDELSGPWPSGHQNLPVMIGPTIRDVVLKLIPEAKIQGRIVDPDGEPIESVPVQVMAEEISNGRKQWQFRGASNTDENGAYRITDLQPGTYLVRTGTAPARLKAANIAPGGKPIAQVYAPAFYPNAPDKASAQAIAIRPAQEFQADFTLSSVRSLSVSGTVTGVQNGAYVTCEDSDGAQSCSISYVNPRTGKFVADLMPPGSWTLRFTSNDAHGAMYFAEQSVNLSTSDINGLQIQLQPLASIPVHVIKGEDPNANVQLQLIPDKPSQNSWLSSTPVPDGSQIFYAVAPGAYRFSAQTFGAGCMESVMSGNVDLMRDELRVSAGQQPAPIDITLADNCASVSGSVRAAKHVNGYVILLSDSMILTPPVSPVLPNGKFQFSNLRPGSYRLYAFSDLANLEYANPEALRNFPSQQIELAAGQQTEIDIDLISRGNP